MSCRQKEQLKPADINPRKFFALVGGLHLTIHGPFSNSRRSAASSAPQVSIACSFFYKNVIYIYIYIFFLQTPEESLESVESRDLGIWFSFLRMF